MDVPDIQQLIASLRRGGQAIGELAQDDTTFRAAVDAFRAQDAESFQRLLGQLKIGPDCERVCGWLCSKECVLQCIELCGFPEQFPTIEQIPRLAEIIARITADEELVEQLADAIQDRDRDGFQRLVTSLEIGPFCQLLCHWACMIRCRLICEVVCAPLPVARKHFVRELAAAGAAIGRLAQNKDALDRVVRGGTAFDCEIVSGVLGGTDDCEIICEWICSWRCVLVCLPLCRVFPPLEDVSIEEMRAFAQVTGRLVSQPEQLRRVVDAVQAENADTFGALVKELQLERFCVQLCHWICGEFCTLFCRCVCPNPESFPHWTQVEVFDIHPAAGLPGAVFSVEGYAGDPSTQAFVFGELPVRGGVMLNGNCPLTNSISGNPLQYRFVIGEWTWLAPAPPDDPTTMPSVPPATATLSPVTQIEQTLVGHVFYADPLSPAPVYINSADAVLSDGWIKINGKSVTVPLLAGGTTTVTVAPGNFLRSDALLLLNSAAITAAHPPKLPGGLPQTQAGRSLTPAEQEPIRRYSLQFEVRDAVSLTTIYTDTLNSIILNNSAPTVALDLEELLNNLCQPLAGQTDAHILYTIDHPHLRSFQISISNNTGQIHPPPAPSGSPTLAMPSGDFTAGSFFFRGGAGGPHVAGGTGGVAVDIQADPVCAYRVDLSWSTRRYGDTGSSAEILYCK
jgi:hypothetical protein